MPEAAIREWHDYYMVAATSAATLLGLLFIAVTLNCELILLASRSHLKAMAAQAFQNYLGVILTAMLALIPQKEWSSFAMQILAVGLALGVLALVRSVRVLRNTDTDFGHARSWKRLVPSLASYLMLAFCGWHFRERYSDTALLILAMAELVLLVSATAITCESGRNQKQGRATWLMVEPPLRD